MKGAFEEIAAPAQPQAKKPQESASPLLETLAKLKSATTEPPRAPASKKKRSFTPGPTEAASGMTVHQIMRDPVTLGALADEIEAWEKSNPRRKLLGPAMAQIAQNVLPDISEGQAARLAKRIDSERKKLLLGKDQLRSNRASASAALGRT